MCCAATALFRFGGNDIDFTVVASCPKSAGSVAYDYSINRSGVIGNTISRTCTWGANLASSLFSSRTPFY